MAKNKGLKYFKVKSCNGKQQEHNYLIDKNYHLGEFNNYNRGLNSFKLNMYANKIN